MNENKKIDDFINRAKGRTPLEIIGLFASEREELLSESTKEDEEALINTVISNMNEKEMERARKFLVLLRVKE